MFAWRFMQLKSAVRKSLYGVFPKQFAGKLISAVISLFLNGMLMFVVLVSTNGWEKGSPHMHSTGGRSRRPNSPLVSGAVRLLSRWQKWWYTGDSKFRNVYRYFTPDDTRAYVNISDHLSSHRLPKSMVTLIRRFS